jgi:hypothetical protein
LIAKSSSKTVKSLGLISGCKDTKIYPRTAIFASFFYKKCTFHRRPLVKLSNYDYFCLNPPLSSRPSAARGALGFAAWLVQESVGKTNIKVMTKRETIKFIVQMIASIATAIVTALGATSCMGA